MPLSLTDINPHTPVQVSSPSTGLGAVFRLHWACGVWSNSCCSSFSFPKLRTRVRAVSTRRRAPGSWLCLSTRSVA